LEQLSESIERVRPDVVVNAAAYTAVDRAESDSDLAHLINARAPAAIARSCNKINALLVHYSSDYVFDGKSSLAYREEDRTDPQSVYGVTKLAGESAIQALCNRHLILGTSWVFGAHGNNFLKTIFKLAQEKQALQVVCDEYGTPTSASFLAEATAKMAGHVLRAMETAKTGISSATQPAFGTYHLACSGKTSWHAYACYLLKTSRLLGMPSVLDVENVESIPSKRYKASAPRPAFSVLSTQKVRHEFQIEPPMWEIEVAKVLLQLKANSNNET
jgi:dTDP-4-dehydrorhamnose reductase